MSTFLKARLIVKQYPAAENTVMSSLGELFYCRKHLELEFPFIGFVDESMRKIAIVDNGEFIDTANVPEVVMTYQNIEEYKKCLV